MNTLQNKIKLFSRIIILVALAGLISCQKVINYDLNSASPQLVVNASISDKPGPYIVMLTKTVNLDEIDSIPPVTGAKVTISDTTGISDTLSEIKKGIYRTNVLQGIPGHTYTLTIKTNGETYESVSRMPYRVTGLKLTAQREVRDRPSLGGGGNKSPKYQVNYEITDPENFKNYYRFTTYRKNRELKTGRAFSDQFHNGKLIIDNFSLSDTTDFVAGDTVLVELQNIDQGTFNFFRTLRDGFGGLGFLSASPSNPISNISNNGLGYFSAYSTNTGFVVIPNK